MVNIEQSFDILNIKGILKRALAIKTTIENLQKEILKETTQRGILRRTTIIDMTFE